MVSKETVLNVHPATTLDMRNPVKPLPFTEGALDTYAKYGVMMFKQQQLIYRNIIERLRRTDTVLEAGCGIGLGTALMQQRVSTSVRGTDNLAENVKISHSLYPWIRFDVWDIENASPFLPIRFDVVVAVEVIEHVSNASLALRNLCEAAYREVWISTPNGLGKVRPPDNPYHVMEYTPREMLHMIQEIPGKWGVEIFEHEKFTPVGLGDYANPLVYKLTRERKV